jgi:enoyl-CoA hydratase/carnithine racemase
MIKGLITANAVETDLAAVHRREMDALNTAFKEPAHQEAVQAFMEKRPPVFRR